MSFRIIFLLLAGGALLYFIFGGPILGPTLDFHANKQNLRNFICNCPRNEVRLRFYDTEYKEFMNVRIDLTTRTLGISGGMIQYDTWDYCWMSKPHGVFHTITFPLGAPLPPDSLSDEQLVQLKSALNAMPPASEGSPNFNWIHDECYLAFYRQEELQIDHFVPGHVPPQFRSVCMTFGFGPLFEAWNHFKMP